jgi:hypothetical protein
MIFQNKKSENGVDSLQDIVQPIESDDIEFVLPEDQIGKYEMPEPAHKYLPDWYKSTQKFMEKSKLSKTVRACMPFMESLTFGWIIPVPTDIEFQQKTDGTKIKWVDENFNAMGKHELEQLGGDMFPHQDISVIKFNLPYVIRTPRGVSTLYMPPLNRFESRFRPFSGVVDTDTYVNEINIPAVLWDTEYEGVIKAGTPIAQIIPFDRDSLVNTSVKRTMTDEEERLTALTGENVPAVDAYYKKEVWSPKKASREATGCPFHKDES